MYNTGNLPWKVGKLQSKSMKSEKNSMELLGCKNAKFLVAFLQQNSSKERFLSQISISLTRTQVFSDFSVFQDYTPLMSHKLWLISYESLVFTPWWFCLECTLTRILSKFEKPFEYFGQPSFFNSVLLPKAYKSIKPELVERAKEELPLTPIYNLNATDEEEDWFYVWKKL